MTKLEQLKNAIKPFIAPINLDNHAGVKQLDQELMKILCPAVKHDCGPGHCESCWNQEAEPGEYPLNCEEQEGAECNGQADEKGVDC